MDSASQRSTGYRPPDMRRLAAARAIPVTLGVLVALIAGSAYLGVGSAPPAPDTAAAAASLEPSATPGGTATPAQSELIPGSSTPPGSLAPSPFPSKVPLPQPLTAEQRDALLQKTLDRFRKGKSIPGMSVTILFADGSSWTGGSGLADVAASVPVTARTAFAVASVSKTFLAALIMELVQEGKLRLDARVDRYLPELNLDSRITVRELLDHTSGLADYFLNPKIDPALQRAPARVWTARQSLAYVGKRYFPPGKGWRYSNTNYLILGLLAERVGKASLAQQFRKWFFGPLDLSSTFYQLAEKPRGPLATGYRLVAVGKSTRAISLADGTGVAPFTSVISATGGAGSIAATSVDLARWARALYGGDVLAPETLSLMVADAASTARYKPRIPYGLGVQTLMIDGQPSLGHSGRLLGFRSQIRYFPNQQLAISVVSNQSRTDIAPLLARLVAIAFKPVVAD